MPRQPAQSFFANFEPAFQEDIGRRFLLEWRFDRIAKDEPADQAANVNGDPYFTCIDTAANPTIALVADGLSLTTGATAADDAIIRPHSAAELIGRLGTAGCTSVAGATELFWAVKMPATITSGLWAVGGGHDIASTVSTTTDNQDKVLITYSGSGNWFGRISRDGVVTSLDLKVPVVASARYVLGIKFDASFRPNFYINGAWAGMIATDYRRLKDDGTTVNEFMPHAFVETSTTAARNIILSGVRYSRVYA